MTSRDEILSDTASEYGGDSRPAFQRRALGVSISEGATSRNVPASAASAEGAASRESTTDRRPYVRESSLHPAKNDFGK